MADSHGFPCWYELTTPDPAKAGEFYGPVMGWTSSKAPMEGFDYYLATRGDKMVAGMAAPQDPSIPPNWLTYFATRDADASAAAVVAEGGQQIVPPTDIPGTGRFAILTDPQGAHFGILQPLDNEGTAFAPGVAGHGSWHELMTPDPGAALDFYTRHFGWTPSTPMDMGEMGTYQLIAVGGADMGGIMRLPQTGMPPAWLPYFTVASIDAAMAKVTESGGKVVNGPMEVPGGAWIFHGIDPQGAYFAVTGPR